MPDHRKVSLKWKRRFLRVAREVSTWSKDPSTKVGVVAAGDFGQMNAQGFNGFPRNISDDKRLENRPEKYKYTVHAEMNLIINANISGVNLLGSSIFIYGLLPCTTCASVLIQLGVREIVFCPGPSDNLAQWEKDWAQTVLMFQEAQISYHRFEEKFLDESE